MEGCDDGVWRGHRYFTCAPGRAFFCPITSLRPDSRIPQPCKTDPAKNRMPTYPESMYLYILLFESLF